MEVYKINNFLIRQGLTNNSKGIKKESEKKLKNKKEVLRKARNNIIRLIQCNLDMTTFVTLTFAEESNFIESKRYLNNLFTKLRKKYNNLKYLWVLEYGELKGRLHYHFLCNIPIDIKLNASNEAKSIEHKNLELEFKNKYWKYGWVDIRSFTQEKNINVALYVSEYITKSIRLYGMEKYRVYGYSKNTLKKPIVVTLESKATIEDIIKAYSDYVIRYSNSYKIGYTDWKGENMGEVTYLDFYRRDMEL